MSKVVRLSDDTLQELEHFKSKLLLRYKNHPSHASMVSSLSEDRLLFMALVDANQYELFNVEPALGPR